MIDEIVWTQGATTDLQETFGRLEDIGEGRGVELIDQVEFALGLLKEFPEIAPKFGNRLRRKLVGKKCEFGIFYSIIGSRIIIAAVLDLRQDPDQIRRTLKQRGG